LEFPNEIPIAQRSAGFAPLDDSSADILISVDVDVVFEVVFLKVGRNF